MTKKTRRRIAAAPKARIALEALLVKWSRPRGPLQQYRRVAPRERIFLNPQATRR